MDGWKDKHELNRLRQRPVVSAALVIINAGVFLICMFGRFSLYDICNVGGLNIINTLWEKNEYWRIITAMFLHSGTGHLFSNMIILFFVGAIIEKEVGHVKFTILYFLSGIGGNVLSLLVKMMMRDPAYSIGASGAVFGLDGALLAMILFWDRKLLDVTPARVIMMILLSVYGGFTGGNIDNAAHVGGLVTGFAIGCVLCLMQRLKHRHTRQINE